MTNPEVTQARELERSPAQFFFEVGYGACFAEVLIRNGMHAPFDLTDAVVEHAWDIAGEAYEVPEEFDRYLELANAALNQEAPAEPAGEGWRCFHCGDYFSDRQCAKQHFGIDEGKTPACLIAGADGGLLKALRDAEEQADEAIQRMHDESTDAAKAYHRQRCRHTQALIAAEESGYEKGLRDGQALAPQPTQDVGPLVDDVASALANYLTDATLRKRHARGERDKGPTRAAEAAEWHRMRERFGVRGLMPFKNARNVIRKVLAALAPQPTQDVGVLERLAVRDYLLACSAEADRQRLNMLAVGNKLTARDCKAEAKAYANAASMIEREDHASYRAALNQEAPHA